MKVSIGEVLRGEGVLNALSGVGALPSGLLLAFTNSVPIAAVTAGVAGLTYLPAILVLLRLLDQRTKVRR